MAIGIPLKHYKGDHAFDAVVIGSGIGGLTTAVLLAKRLRKRVVVLERHSTAGGFTHVFRRPGFEWDVGVHYVGDVHRPGASLRRLFDALTDRQLEWAPMGPVYDRVRIADRGYDLVAGRDAFVESLARAFPSERQAIGRYLDALKACAGAARGFFAEKAVPAAVAALAGGLMRRRFLSCARRTTREVLGEITRNRELLGVLTAQYGDYGLPPGQSSFAMHAMVAHHYLNGAAYPVGGAESIARTMVPLIEREGGCVVVDAEVTEVLIDGGAATGARVRSGAEFRAPLVVSDAGLATTVRQLLPRSAPGREALEGIVSRVGPSLGHACLYVGLDRAAEDLGLDKANLWVYPGPDHDANVAAFIANPEAPLPLTYLSFPSAKDPEFAQRHPGHATIEALTLAPYEWFQPWASTRWRKRGPEYERLKQQLADRLLEQVTTHVPAARGHIVHAELSTPLSTRHFANYESGEIYGLSHPPARFLERGLRPRTGIHGFFLTGQDVCTAGVAGALFGGLLTASAIAKRNLGSGLYF
jgi:all-trans-retinol 13,14-reductase